MAEKQSDRHIRDYDTDLQIQPERAEQDIQDAREFVSRVEDYLEREGWL